MGTAQESTVSERAYAAGFYEGQLDGSLQSAQVVAPRLIDLVRPTSVLDVGCGVGTWLRAFVEHGVSDVVGVDGDYVERSLLQIDAEKFRPADLARPFDLGRRFDLVISLEVGEHIDESDADCFVASIVRHGDVIAFSAAVPFQGGTQHVNEQWPSYWIEKFAKHGYACLDILRPALWGASDVEYWYAQNLFLFVAHAEADSDRWAEARAQPTLGMIDAVHPGIYESQHRPIDLERMSPRWHVRLLGRSLAEAGRVGVHFPRAVTRSLRRRRAAR